MSTNHSDKRAMTVGVVMGVFGVIGIAIVLFLVWRMKSKPARDDSQTPSEGGYVFTGFGGKQDYQGARLRETHPGTRIHPFVFSANGDGPVYDHAPGANMRIASRREDGIWAFHDIDPSTGSPHGINEPAPAPTTPFSSASSTFTFEPRGYAPNTRRDSAARSPGVRGGRTKSSGNYFDMVPGSPLSAFTPPPPTYGTASPQVPPPAALSSMVQTQSS